MAFLILGFISQAVVLLSLLHFLVDYIRYADQFPRLADLPLPPNVSNGQPLPPLAVIVPARNEESRIHICLRSLAASINLGPFKIFAVNDRSKDRTEFLMREEAQRSSKGIVEVVTIKSLPNGWLGKNHACWVGAQTALAQTPKPKYLLFADGDITFHPQALAQAVTHMDNQNLDFLTAFPQTEYGGRWESAFLVHFGFLITFFSRPWSLGQPGGRNFLGVGAFLMVKAEAYEKAGGHQTLKYEVADDMKLGLLFRAQGFRCGAVNGVKRLQLRWQNGFVASLKGLLKNGYAAHEFSLFKIMFSTIFSLAFFVAPWVCFFLTPLNLYLGSLGALNLMTLLCFHLVASHKSEMPGVTGFLLMPFISLIVAATFIASAVLTISQGGIQWRENFYVLSDLKRHCFTRKKAFATSSLLRR